jgi:hypothetical protein
MNLFKYRIICRCHATAEHRRIRFAGYVGPRRNSLPSFLNFKALSESTYVGWGSSLLRKASLHSEPTGRAAGQAGVEDWSHIDLSEELPHERRLERLQEINEELQALLPRSAA